MGSGLATSVQARNSYVSSTIVSERLSNANELEKIFK
jgi:Ca2+-binding EF-hand superfamily protein